MSSLNPEAPEFIPSLSTMSEHSYNAVSNGIRASNMLPNIKESNKVFQIFQEICRQLTSNLLNISNKILHIENIIKIKKPNKEISFDTLIEANDSILDVVNIEMESTNRLDSRILTKSNNMDHKACKCFISSWNAQPIMKTNKRVKETTVVSRPQLKFKEKVNNSNKMFIPTLKDKPNAKMPFCLNIIYSDGEPIGYEHPYNYELLDYKPPEVFLFDDLHLLKFPKPIEQSNFIYVDNEAKLNALIADLSTVFEIAIDLEHHDFRTFLGFTCLIQISTNKTDYIIDALALRHCLSSLNLIFTDPNKLKILHGSKNDILWLQKDFGVYIVGLYDTFHAARQLNLPYCSLKYLAKYYCDVDIDKTYQKADWRQRPLSQNLIKYARMDTHYLIYIWRATKKYLLEKNGGIENLLAVFDNSKTECLQKYNKPIFNEKSLLDLLSSFNKKFNSSQSECLKRLFVWRDEFARKEDESLRYVLPDHNMVKLAEELPREKEGVVACCGSTVPPLLFQNLNAIHKIIIECRQLPIQPTLFHMPQGIATVLNMEECASLPVDETHQLEFRDDKPTINNEKLNYKNVKEETESKHFHFSKMANILELTIEKSGARSFSPPFERYRKYRSLAQIEEMQVYQKKETMIMQAQKAVGGEANMTQLNNYGSEHEESSGDEQAWCIVEGKNPRDGIKVKENK